MKKIVIDAREYTTSTGRYMFRLLQYLEKIDEAHDYIILHKPHDMEAHTFTNPHFTKVVCPYKEFTFSEQLGYLKLLRSLKPDLVHFGKTEQPVLYRGLSVTTVHDLTNALMHNPSRYRNALYFKFKQLVYRWVIKKVARKTHTIITPTNFVKDQLAGFAHIDPAKIAVTLESADPIDAMPEAYSPAEGKEFIMYVGRPTLHKNLSRLIDAFTLLQKSRPELYLILAGKTDANYREHAARVEHDDIKNVVFTDFISDGQLRWLYEHCAGYVFPSLSEGFGLPPLEAMTHGAPVIASNATAIPEVCGEAAHYFDPLDVHDMAAKIADVLDNEKLRQALISKGRERIKQYSWQRMAEQTLAIYKNALGE